MRKRRPGYTLLEVLLAMAIAVMLLAAVYSVIGYQLRQAQAGRDLIEQATLARAILNKIDADVRVTLTLGDPARFRRQPEGQSGGSGGGSGGGMGTSGAGMSTTPMTGAGAGTSGANNTSGTQAGGTSGMESTDSAADATTTTAVTIPLGVIGGANDLHLFGSKFPNEAYDGQVTCDQRRISYWLGDGEAGLCRFEQRLVTSEEGASTSLPSDIEKYILAPEVKSFDVSYFDGSSWLESWDSTELGPDEKTPKGSPRAIKVRVGLNQLYRKDGELKYHTHVILIPTAGGMPPATTPDTAEAAATTTSPP